MNFDFTTVPEARLEPIWESAYTTRNGLKHGYLCAAHVVRNNIPGVIVECGVANGVQVGMMARAVQDSGKVRDFHLFDSFEGIPMAGPNDADQPGIGKPKHDVNAPLCERLKSSGVSVGSILNVKNNLVKWNTGQGFIFHKGWFQDTLPALVDFQPIALLRLDGDLYESTLVCLEHLYAKVVPGGLVVIDDWSLPGCEKAVTDFLNDFYGAGMWPIITLTEVGVGYQIATWTK